MSANEKKHALDSAAQTEGSRAKKPKLADDAASDAPAGPFVTGAFISAAAAAANGATFFCVSFFFRSFASSFPFFPSTFSFCFLCFLNADERCERAEGSTSGQPPVVDEAQERRKQEEIRKIEQEFSQLKEKFFAEKIAALKKEIDQLTQGSPSHSTRLHLDPFTHLSLQPGSHEGYLNELRLLEEKKQRKLLLAEQWRQYQQQCLNLAFESEKKHSEDENLVRRRNMATSVCVRLSHLSVA
jgi:hypothetical protein